MEIYVHTLTAKIITLKVKSSDSVGHVKSLVQSREGIPPDHQRLVFEGELLQDPQKLSYYGIRNKSTVFLVIGLRGGTQ